MKTKRLIYSLTVIILLIGILNCKNLNAQNKFSEEQVKIMLRNFYTSYIKTISSHKQPKYHKLDSIERVYCTPNYFNELRKYSTKLEYNPLLKAQDSDLECLKTLTIKKDSIRDDLYYISYVLPFEKILINIKLTVIKENNDYRIDCVFLDDLKVECPCIKKATSR